jgi:hypothetical protein
MMKGSYYSSPFLYAHLHGTVVAYAALACAALACTALIANAAALVAITTSLKSNYSTLATFSTKHRLRHHDNLTTTYQRLHVCCC